MCVIRLTRLDKRIMNYKQVVLLHFCLFQDFNLNLRKLNEEPNTEWPAIINAHTHSY